MAGYRIAEGVPWLGMSNILHGFQTPAILDLKMGTRTWNTDADDKKIQNQQRKAAESTTGSLGLRVVGGKLLDKDGNFFRVGKKHKHEIMNEEELVAFLSQFLCNASLRASFAERLQTVSDWWHAQSRYAFYASSLLVAYDTDRKDECRINIIDFANCEMISDKSQDLSGFNTGLTALARVLTQLKPI